MVISNAFAVAMKFSYRYMIINAVTLNPTSCNFSILIIFSLLAEKVELRKKYDEFPIIV